MRFAITRIAAAVLAGLATAVVAQSLQSPTAPTVRTVWYETISGGVEQPNGQAAGRQMFAMPVNRYEVKDGVYTSTLSRISLRVPRLADEKLVDVREAAPLTRKDGSPATTHIMFDPDGLGDTRDPARAQSTVIVTRLRDDRPKDAASVIGGLDGGEADRAQLVAGRGFSYARIETKLGPGLHRVIRNRGYSPRFPYDMAILRGATATTFGVTVFAVVGTDSLVEFSQLFPCGQRPEEDCRAAALKAHAEFVDGVTYFKMYPPEKP